MFAKVLLTAGLIFGLSATFAHASDDTDQGVVIAHTTVRNHDVAIYKIHEIVTDKTDKGVEGFAINVAYWFHEWTAKHGVEAVGNICKTPDGSRYGIDILTIYAHTTSPRTNVCPDGMVMTGTDIHSHPQRRRYHVNDVDKLFLHDGLMAEDWISTFPDEFSPEDYQDPDDYLVGLFYLHHEHGYGTSKVVWKMRDPNPYSK